MFVLWLIILLIVIFLVYKITRGLVLTAKCKKIFRMQQKKLKEEGGLTANHFEEEDISGDEE